MVWLSSWGWKCPHVGDSKIAHCLVSIIIEMHREFKLSSTSKEANCTADYNRAEAKIEVLKQRIIGLHCILNDKKVYDRAWDAAYRKIEVCVYGEDFKALLLQMFVPIGITVRALKLKIQNLYGFAVSLQQFSCCVGDSERAILMGDEDHIGQWHQRNSAPLNVRLCIG